MTLRDEQCTPCTGDTAPLSKDDAEKLLLEVPEWSLTPSGTLMRTVSTNDFKTALACANIVGDIAETEGHHPDLSVAWGKLNIMLSTHAIGGLSRNDFRMAAKINSALAIARDIA